MSQGLPSGKMLANFFNQSWEIVLPRSAQVPAEVWLGLPLLPSSAQVTDLNEILDFSLDDTN